jgi:hypothetical protein
VYTRLQKLHLVSQPFPSPLNPRNFVQHLLSCVILIASEDLGQLHFDLRDLCLSMLGFRSPIRLCKLSALGSVRLLPISRPKLFSTAVARYAADMETVNTTERLARLRQLMQENKVDVYSMISHSPPCRSWYK